MAYACHNSIHAVIKNKEISILKIETRNTPWIHFFDCFVPQEIIHIQVKPSFNVFLIYDIKSNRPGKIVITQLNVLNKSVYLYLCLCLYMVEWLNIGSLRWYSQWLIRWHLVYFDTDKMLTFILSLCIVNCFF